jgi:UDP-2-acetamido-3-amino-2,3-dideoxy-glucuronate N-acetyltransferase
MVNKDVSDYALVVGVPARQIGWMSEFGEQLDLPVSGDGEAVCANSGVKYKLSNGKLVRS